MFPNINPKKMKEMMKQIGMQNEDISAEKVTIEKTDGSKIVIKNPSVTKIKMQGLESFQISGDVSEEDGISQADIETVMKKTSVDETAARAALEKSNGDLAEAILELSE